MGKFERGVELSRRAQELNPLHPGWYWFGFARYHYDRGEYADALASVEKTGMTEFYWCYLLKAAALGQLGHPDAAEALARAVELKPDFSARDEILKWNAAPADLEHLMEGIGKAEQSTGG